ncbi:hypothetical protein E2C01_082949 [Portunus trituberculatus]|uniref:Uncharacterized protein n=1 Tax=Portunus trituberculatus TaxID=210409 RepID=A0A5B7J0F8_PORTR|nr:hypothetical protein [Portunus trituberculatus]
MRVGKEPTPSQQPIKVPSKADVCIDAMCCDATPADARVALEGIVLWRAGLPRIVCTMPT